MINLDKKQGRILMAISSAISTLQDAKHIIESGKCASLNEVMRDIQGVVSGIQNRISEEI